MNVADQRVADWLESGVVAITGLVPPGSGATHARAWSEELTRRSAAWGQPVRVDGAQLLAERAAITGARPQAAVSAGGACRLLPCSDGWVAVSLPRESDRELVPALIERLTAEPWTAVSEWAADRTASEVVERARLLGLAVSEVGEGGPAVRLPDETGAPPGGTPPLVVDFSSLWAGPLCASLLGLAGARVIKVESRTRLDGARRGDPHFYDLLHAGHESVWVNPDSTTDRAALARLVAAADVIIEASRPRALAGWGLSAEDAVERGAVWVSITAYGRRCGDRIGFGDDVAAGAGLVGRQAGRPVFVGDAIADPLTGLAAAVGVLRALAAGRGHLIDLSMASVVASTLKGSHACLEGEGAASPPVARTAVGLAPAAGVDTERVFAEFAR